MKGKQPMLHNAALISSGTLLALVLTACGGGGGSNNNGGGGGDTDTSQFTASATWTFDLPGAGQDACYDFDNALQTADCSSTDWDLMVRSSGLTATFWTNSGTTNAAGQGGALNGPFDYTWADLQTWVTGLTDGDGNTIPESVYSADANNGAFVGSNAIQSAAFEYGIGGGHSLYPNYRVFLITTDSSDDSTESTTDTKVFALQITGYYGGATGTTSGYPSFRWIERTDGASVQTDTVNATTAWVYYDLENATVVDVPDANNWHIAFNRYNIMLNGGQSGDGSVAGFVGKTPAGFYDAEGNVVESTFTSAAPADTLADLTAADMATPADVGDWIIDDVRSRLNADAEGTYPMLDYGWYTYNGTVHMLSANPDNGAFIRSGTGDSYARFHLTDITYADGNNPGSQQTWTIEFDVQPAQ